MEDLSNIAPGQIALDADPRSRISANFAIYELTKSDTAERDGIDNSFTSASELEAAVHLSREVLQRVRDHFGSFSPNSVFRSQELERSLKKKPAGWTSESQHTRGEACDIEVPGVSTLDLARWVEENLPFDQLICECYDPRKGPNAGWVHVSLKMDPASNRKKVLSYIKDPAAGKYVYVPGLREMVA